MKKYSLLLITGDTIRPYSIHADSFSFGNDCYNFYYNSTIISCWPISRTVIRDIEDVETDEE